jgi:hypothetical protein
MDDPATLSTEELRRRQADGQAAVAAADAAAREAERALDDAKVALEAARQAVHALAGPDDPRLHDVMAAQRDADGIVHERRAAWDAALRALTDAEARAMRLDAEVARRPGA